MYNKDIVRPRKDCLPFKSIFPNFILVQKYPIFVKWEVKGAVLSLGLTEPLNWMDFSNLLSKNLGGG